MRSLVILGIVAAAVVIIVLSFKIVRKLFKFILLCIIALLLGALVYYSRF